MSELGDNMDASEKEDIEAKIEAVREAVKGDDKEAIDNATQALAEASAKLAERAYAQSSEGEAGDATGQSDESQGKSDEDVVDAEFTEVKDDDKK